MKKYIVLLRGINVGGKNKLPMVELRTLLSNNAYKDVTSYIQSGNILVVTDKSPTEINEHINTLLKQEFNYDIPVVSLSTDELITCFTQNPFLAIEKDLKKIHVTFLKDYPDKNLVANIDMNTSLNDSFSIVGKIIYLYTPGGYGKTKLTNGVFEKKTKCSGYYKKLENNH